MLPNLIIAGAPKSGTTSLFHWLSDHPEVCAAARKELQFFMDEDSSVFRPKENYHVNGIGQYHSYFKHYDSHIHKLVIEATPGYLYQKNALASIYKEIPNAHIIFIFREPSDRFRSIFNYFINNRSELDKKLTIQKFYELVKRKDPSLSNNEFLFNVLEHGHYINYLQPWVDTFSRENITILIYDELIKNPKVALKKLSQKFSISHEFYDGYNFLQKNKTFHIKNQLLHKLAWKINIFFPENIFRNKVKELYFKINGENLNPKYENQNSFLELLRTNYKNSNQKLGELINTDLTKWE